MSALTIGSLVRGIQKGDTLTLGKSISILEDDSPLKAKLIKRLKSISNRHRLGSVIGVTGSAGSGKSTLIAAMAKVMRRDKKRVAILAVDPTSPKSGGAFLGDRVRMQELAEDTGVFIRSMASRGAKGGITRASKDAAFLFLKAGYDFVLIETVGAGQLDYDVTRLADLTLLVLTPEAGDEIQFMKAGLRELVDIFVINKADRPSAQAMENFLKQVLNLERSEAPIFKTIAEQKKGIEPLYQFIRRKVHAKK